MSRLVRLYPAAWRARYGDELEALIADMSDGRRPSWRLRADLARGAGREHLRGVGLGSGGSPAARSRAGALVVLWAWAVFVVAGTAVQRISEHWQTAMPATGRHAASAGFLVLLVAAIAAAVLVVVGIALVAPATLRFLRGGGLAAVLEPLATAVALSATALAATVALVSWPGSGAVFTAGAIAWALLCTAALAAWTAAATAIGRRIALTAAILRAEAALAAAVALAMPVMTAGTALWWAVVARHAPGFLGSSGPALGLALAAMVAASVFGAAGARQAVRR